jgi:predicted PhzF superfamily epimerase YddE/YHI9
MQSIDIYRANAFTQDIFAGNPAAVCILEHWLAESVLQRIAKENNLSETAFLVPCAQGFQIRWFAPDKEVQLCGHATLAAGYVVMNFLQPHHGLIRFQSPDRELVVRKKAEDWELEFPRFAWDLRPPESLESPLKALRPLEVLWGNETLILRLAGEKAVEDAKPDLAYLRDSKTFLAITAQADPGANYDFVTRFFAPSVGVDEDPVTGSVHCLLGPYWSDRLKKRELKARQLSARGGTLTLSIATEKVFIAGQACLYMAGKIMLSHDLMACP